MAGNEVTLTFAGDATQLERASREATQAVERVATSVGSAEDAFATAARNSGRLGESLDRVSGTASMISGGLGDVGGALTEAFGEESAIGAFGAQMEKAGAITMFFTGAADLAIVANTLLSSSFVKNAASQVAARTATIASTVATGAATAAQWLWNAAMTANPIGLIIVAIAALVAAIVYIAVKTTWFQDLWQKIWGGIVSYIHWVLGNYQKVFSALAAAGSWLVDKFRVVASAISAPFRAAFNFIADAWNNTIGRLSWSVPSWVPGIGGASISVPRLPKFHSGGVVPGAPGSEMLAILQAGETVIPASGSGRTVLEIRSGGSSFDDALVELLARAVRVRGGDVQLVLGGARG